ncbi:MAG: flagellar motor switch protein FliN [Desulfobacteraceae bacterium]|nr:flagellar motor switch protein FliN [Desulfobacteraceae bacterium]MCF8094261.1 flagellar motor switch protein FliN [Desulfobacteraceae bacterium]
MVDSKTNNQGQSEEKTAPSKDRNNEKPEAKNPGDSQNERGHGEAAGIEFLLDVPLQVSVEVGRARMLIKDFLQMKEGGVIELDKMADEPLDLYVNNRLIARGEAVVVNEKFGLRLIDVVSTSERIEKLR